MNCSVLAGCVSLVLVTSVQLAHAQVAGSTKVSVEFSELQQVVIGWSAKQILGHGVFNEKGQRLGTVDDLIVSPDRALSFAIIGTGWFVTLARHDIAVPVNQIHLRNKRLVIDGASKAAIGALPPFEYSNGK